MSRSFFVTMQALRNQNSRFVQQQYLLMQNGKIKFPDAYKFDFDSWHTNAKLIHKQLSILDI